MKKFISKQKNCLWTLLGVIMVCELLLKINNRVIQSIGIVLTPIIAILVVSVKEMIKKNLINKNEEISSFLFI